jgi:tetratricopeptide (TPR) repeat protein
MCFAGSDHDVSLFDAANALYLQGSYADALAEYQKITHKTGQVWYNMASGAYRQKEYTLALLYVLRAQKYGDVDTYRAAHTLLRDINSVVELPDQSMFGTIHFYLMLLIKKIPVLIWQLLVLLMWYTICILWMKKYGYSNLKKGLLALLLILMCVPIMVGYYTDRQQMLIIEESADLYNGPNSALYKIGTLPKNSLVSCLEEKRQWYKVMYNESIGWLKRSSVEKI